MFALKLIVNYMEKKESNLINLTLKKKYEKKFKKIGLYNNNTYLIGDWCDLKSNFYKKSSTFKYINFFKIKNISQKTNDSQKILRYYEKSLTFLVKNLNNIHKTKHTRRFWELLLSRWLFTFITHVYSRWDLINKVHNKYNIKTVVTNELNEKKFIPENTNHAHFTMQSMKNDNWSINIINQILKFKFKNLKFETLEKNSLKSVYKKEFAELEYDDVLNICSRKKIFFYNLSLAKKLKLALMAKNKFLNMNYAPKKIKIPRKFNISLREKISNVEKKNKDKFFQLLITCMKYNLPKIFLENFKLLKKTYEKLNWPKNPNYIMTSYGQYYNEIFKLYCANQKKSKLFILQHGYNNIFADGDFYAGNLDKKISTKFLTWGNLKKDNSLPFIFPYHNKNVFGEQDMNKKKILMILYSFNETLLRPVNGFISGTEINKIIVNNVLDFMKSCSKHLIPIKKFDLKLLNASRGNSVENSLKYNFPALHFYKKKNLFIDVIKNYKFSIHFFLGTPFIESMYYNKPCILILKRDIHLNFDNDFNSMIKKLIKVKICFEDIGRAFIFFNSNKEKIQKWWESKEVQRVRELYCNQYCNNIEKNHKIFEKIFK